MMTQQEMVMQELKTSPVVRFLKINAKTDEELRRDFRDALVHARVRATARAGLPKPISPRKSAQRDLHYPVKGDRIQLTKQLICFPALFDSHERPNV